MIDSRSYFKRNLGKLAMTLVGRKQLLRLSRYFLNESRFDTSNDMEHNGELLLQAQVLDLQDQGYTGIYLDVGANKGDWTKKLHSQVPPDKHIMVYCFEPSKDTVALLEKNLKEVKQGYRVVNKAASNNCGTASLFIAGEGLGINSLHRNFEVEEHQIEKIDLITLDEFVMEHQIDKIHFIKIDAEGHDYSVLEGARELLMGGKVNFIQFEYSWRWIENRKFLKDVFTFANPMGYDLGKITRKGIEFYRHWDADLESFIENNYLLVKRKFRGKLKEINWWKERTK